MKVPGFTAEAGLYKAGKSNNMAGKCEVSGPTDHRNLVEPQGPVISLACWIICRAAGGTRQQCLEFCTVVGTIFPLFASTLGT